jgi:ribosomal protein L37AE/L43A
LSLSLFALFLSMASHTPQIGDRSSCGDCHIANPDASSASHLSDWEYSAHGRNGVGCEKCHGGNPRSYEEFIAHQGMLNSGNPSSPVNWRNLPQTCGACHIGPFVAFQKSAHFSLLENGDRNAPSCSTCHGDVAARLLAPSGLAKQCEKCHGDPKGASYHPDYAAQGKLIMELVRETRASLAQAPPLIDRIRDADRRAHFQDAYEQAQVPLIEAVSTAHSFNFAEVEERLKLALQSSEALMNELANP